MERIHAYAEQMRGCTGCCVKVNDVPNEIKNKRSFIQRNLREYGQYPDLFIEQEGNTLIFYPARGFKWVEDSATSMALVIEFQLNLLVNTM